MPEPLTEPLTEQVVRAPVGAAPFLRKEADRASRNAAITLGLTLPGDTVLYLILPLHAAAFGVSLPEAGILLAANRLVRIAGYGWVARGYERFGPRGACLLAALGAAASTLGYALLSGVEALVVARLLWGLSFAALNIATQALATVEFDRAARRSGKARAIISAGPMLGLLAGAMLAEAVGPRTVFLALAAIALLALPVAVRLPGGRGQAVLSRRRRIGLPAPLDLWSFIQGLTLDGVFVVGLSLLASAASPKGATLAAGAGAVVALSRRDRAGTAERSCRRTLGRGADDDCRFAAFVRRLCRNLRRLDLDRDHRHRAAARGTGAAAGSGRGDRLSRRGAGAGDRPARHVARPRRRDRADAGRRDPARGADRALRRCRSRARRRNRVSGTDLVQSGRC